MNEIPPSRDESEDVDDHYRRGSALDPSRPSEPVRRAVLDHAVRLAAARSAEERKADTAPARIGSTRPARHRTWWRPAAFGTLAAAMLAGVLIAPQFLTRRAPPRTAPAPAQVSQPNAESMPKARSEAKARSAAKARSGAAASSDSETDARRTPAFTPPVSGMLAAPRAAAPVPQEPAAELRRAAQTGDVATLQSLLGKQPVIDARDDDGRTALMLATLHGQAAAVDALLARGADPNAADARGMTPLQAAVAGNQPAIVTALQRAGAR